MTSFHEASKIGHGQLGIRSGLRTLKTLRFEAYSEKQNFIEFRGGKIVSGWAVFSGSTYSVLIDEVSNGRRLDVVNVRTQTETLRRVEQLSDIVAGTYYFDPNDHAASYLFVRLTDLSSPGATANRVLAQFGWYFATHRTVQPTFGPDKMVDGALDVWSSSTALTNYTTVGGSGTSGASLNRDSSFVAEGTYSARLEATIVPGGFFPLYPNSGIVCVNGTVNCFSAYYATDPGNPDGIVPQLRMTSGSSDMADDGRSIISSNPITLANTMGEWRKVVFFFLAPNTLMTPIFYLSSLNRTGFGRMWVDGWKFQRVYRFEQFEPRLSDTSLPNINEGRQTIYFGDYEIGAGVVNFMNDTAFFENLFGAYEFSSGDVYQRIGGRFQNGGNEILSDNQYLRRWIADSVGPVSPFEAQLGLFEPRQVISEILPRRSFGVDVYPHLAVSDIGRPRALNFGLATNVTPALVDNTLPVSFPLTYEVTDGASGVNGLHGAATDVHVYSYLDTQAAERQDAGNRVELVNTGTGIEFAYDFATGQFLVGNAIPMQITTENNKIDFNIGGGALVATIPSAIYVAGLDDGTVHKGLSKAIVTAMNTAAGVTDFRCVFDMATKKITISKVAGVLNLLCKTGVNEDVSVWKTIGFNKVIDRVGALTYLGDNEIYTTPEEAILRADIHGFKDDASGTYTGTANAMIQLGGDVIYFLLNRLLGVNTANIDIPSFVALRSGASSVRVMLGSIPEPELSVAEIFKRLETGLGADLIFNGDKFSLRRRDNISPNDILEIRDRHLIGEIEDWYDAADMGTVFVVGAAFDPTSSQVRNGILDSTNGNASIQAWCLDARARIGREVVKDFSTYLWDITGTPINELVRNGTMQRRRFRFTVKNIGVLTISGDKIRLYSSNFLGKTVANPYVDCRVLTHDWNPHTWESTFTVAEVLSVSNGW